MRTHTRSPNQLCLPFERFDLPKKGLRVAPQSAFRSARVLWCEAYQTQMGRKGNIKISLDSCRLWITSPFRIEKPLLPLWGYSSRVYIEYSYSFLQSKEINSASHTICFTCWLSSSRFVHVRIVDAGANIPSKRPGQISKKNRYRTSQRPENKQPTHAEMPLCFRDFKVSAPSFALSSSCGPVFGRIILS